MSLLPLNQKNLYTDFCKICLEDITNKEIKENKTTLLKCSHIFHKYCINSWLKNPTTTCPKCQALADDKGLSETPLFSWSSLIQYRL